MRKKGFTLVELLVVIAIIALLMSILMPALAKVRSLAQRVVCGSHLSSIGKQMMVYANDNKDKYPRAGGMNSKWGATLLWNAPVGPPAAAPYGEPAAYKIPTTDPATSPNTATVGACLFYLIKYADAAAKVFNCGGDSDAREFQVNANDGVYNNNILEAWDFGANPRQYYSYAYQYPFTIIGFPGNFAVSPLSDSGIVTMADKSPYIVTSTDGATRFFKLRTALTPGSAGTEETERSGNSANHKREGQNVLYNDGHVSWQDTSNVGFDSDNIYTCQADPASGNMGVSSLAREKQLGWLPPVTTKREFYGPLSSTDVLKIYPHTKTDTILINEGTNQLGVDPS